MQARAAQVGVDQQNSPSVLPHQYLRQICRGKRFSFFGQRTGHQDFLESHLLARVIEPGAQGAELLGTPLAVVSVKKKHRLSDRAAIAIGDSGPACASRVKELPNAGIVGGNGWLAAGSSAVKGDSSVLIIGGSTAIGGGGCSEAASTELAGTETGGMEAG